MHHKGQTTQTAVLLAEDNLDDVLITKRVWMKSKLKSKLYIVNDGEEALDFLKKQGKYKDAPNISLMLLDLKMPKLNGLEVLEQVKNDVQLKKLPIIMLTTSNRMADVNKAYQTGCNSYIVKPIGFENFKAAIALIERFWFELSTSPV